MKLARFLPRFRTAYRSLETLEAREHWLRSDIEAFQLQRLNSVWGQAIAHVPYYRKLASEIGAPHRFASVAEFSSIVPVLPKAAIQAEPRALYSEIAARGHWTRTGGSTGRPMNCYWATEAHLEMLRCKYRFLASWDRDFFDRTAFLWGHSTTFKPGLMGRVAKWRMLLEDRFRNRIRLSAYRLGRDTLRDYLRRIAAFRPTMLYGYSRALALLAQEAEATGFRCDSLKLAVLTGEPTFPHYVTAIERAFQIPAAGEYGSVECGFLAGEGPDRVLRVREDLVLLETPLRDDGRYDVLVTILNNPSFPLLRYAIGDVTDAPLDIPPVGFARLFAVAGRNNDLVISHGGAYLHSAHFDALFKYETSAIRGFRVRQHPDGSLHVALELRDPQAQIDLGGLAAKLRGLVEGYPVSIEVVEALPQTPAGKHRLVISDLDPVAATPRPTGINGRRYEQAGERQLGDSFRPAATAVTPEASNSLPDAEQLRRASVGAAKAARLRQLLHSPELTFITEAHNGLSAKIVEEAGFEVIWASGLSISAALGVRDSNEASWTQLLEVLEFMADSTRIPILVDGDTGYGNFNNLRRLVRKLEQRGIAGVCIEDKLFPKTNSFIRGTTQPLAEVAEFCGRIRAGKDVQRSPEFVIIARVEALIAGWGINEALGRAEAYRQAGADAIFIHSAKSSAAEVIAFKEEWGDRLPVVVAPTKYYTTPTDVFRKHGFSAVIWANHLLRSSIAAMQRTAQEIFADQTLLRVEERVAPLAEVFRLQGESELAEAEKRYLPKHADQPAE
jgi:phosphoenolpyruvate phosphomutase